MSDAVFTIPRQIEILSAEVLPIEVDVTDLLDDGETPSTPVITLTDMTTGAAYASGLSGSPAFVGNVCGQTITTLVGGHSYRLLLTFLAAVGKTRACALLIECPF